MHPLDSTIVLILIKKPGARQHYIANPVEKHACSRQHYSTNPEKKRACSRHALGNTILLILRKGVHTPDNSIELILREKRLPHVHTWLSTMIICVLKKELSMY